MKIFIFLRTLLSYFLGFIISIIFLVPAILLLLLPKKLRPEKIIFYLLYLFYKFIVYILFMPIEIVGKENLLNKPVIFVANHQSSLDIPLIGMLINGKKHLWLVLERYKEKFILGFFIKKLFITIDQSSQIKSAKSLIKTIKELTENPQDLIIFPEGGRFTDGKIHKFFKGFVVLAQKTGLPLTLIYMKNNYKIYPPYTFLIYYNKIKLKISEPIYMSAQDSIESFCEKVHNWFEKQIE